MEQKPQMALIEEVVPKKSNVRAGERLQLSVRMRRPRGDEVVVPITVQVPRDAVGSASVFVGGGVEMDRRDADVTGVRYPATLDALLGLLGERRPARALFARVYFPSPGLRSDAELMDALPPSARATLGQGPERTLAAVDETMGPDVKVPFAQVVVGGMTVPINVVR